MATQQQSIDIFLETIDIIVMYLNDGHVLFLEGFDPKGRRHQGGDLLNLSRETGEATLDCNNLVVVLGWGERREEAVAASKEYIRRVARWHGDSDEFETELSLMGFDLSQSEVFM